MLEEVKQMESIEKALNNGRKLQKNASLMLRPQKAFNFKQ